VARPPAGEPFAVVGGRLLTGLLDVTTDPAALDGPGTWAVVVSAEGCGTFARFACCSPLGRGAVAGELRTRAAGPWPGIALDQWSSSLDRDAFEAAVVDIRSSIAAGDVYQVNLTRRLSAPLPAAADPVALAARLAVEHPAPFAATIALPERDLWVVSASPERFLERRGRRVRSSPIKGTAAEAAALLPKDRAENIMIVDLVRNDLGRVCDYGSITVPDLLTTEVHPGLVHLVSTVEGRLAAGRSWADLLEATFPPGSVTGAPKLAALDHIRRLEPVERGVYCGTVGWVDGTACEGELNVAIRTFFAGSGMISFGTGGGITWGSTPEGEWHETELKARRLMAIAATPDP
jgi:para-aminobenzoate synthetase component 1